MHLPQALQIVLPSVSRRQSGVVNVPQLLHDGGPDCALLALIDVSDASSSRVSDDESSFGEL
jgi:hypothetical protein